MMHCGAMQAVSIFASTGPTITCAAVITCLCWVIPFLACFAGSLLTANIEQSSDFGP